MRISLFPLLTVVLFIAACDAGSQQAFDPEQGEWIDLGHVYDEDTIYWPTADKFRLETVSEGETEGGYYYSAYRFATAEHGGTHLDAPVHFAAGKQSTEQVPLSRLTGPAVVIDISHKVKSDADYLITRQDIADWEDVHGKIPGNAQLLFYTGWSAKWPDAAEYMGTDERGVEGAAKLRFPGLSPEAASFLADERQIESVGIDTASLDYGRSTAFEAHRILMEKNIVGYENLTGLAALPATGSYLVALPMTIRGGSGGPLRIAAFVPSAAR